MNCERIRKQILEALASASVEVSNEISSHLQACRACQEFHDRQALLFRSIDSAVRTLVNEPVPPSLLAGVRERLTKTAPSHAWGYVASAIAATAVLVLAWFFPVSLFRHTQEPNAVPASSALNYSAVQTTVQEAKRPAKRHRASRSEHHAIILQPGPLVTSRSPQPANSPQIIVDVKESQAIFLLAKAVYEEPKWGRAMLSPVPVPEDIAPSMKPVMVPDLEIKSIDEGGD